MPFETRPFDLGNTLAKAAQIQSLQNRNELSKINLEQTRGINNALATDDINSLSNFGSQGAKLEAQLTKLAREGKQAEFEQGIKLARISNKAARGAIESVDVRQAGHLMVQGLSSVSPEMGKKLSNLDFLSMTDEEATSTLQEMIGATDFSTRPDRVSQMTSPFEVRNIQQGDENVTTVLDRITKEPVKELGRGSRRQQVEQGPPGAFGTSSQRGAQQVELETRVAAVNAFGSQAKRLLDIIEKTPGANTVTAAMTNVGNRIMNEVRTLSNSLGIEFESGGSAFDVSRYGDVFKEVGLAGANPRVKNGFLGLAIQRAIASGLGTGRALSDKDIEQQLKTLGRNQSDPDIIARIFTDSFENLVDSVTFQHRATPGLKLPEIVRPDFGVSVGKTTKSTKEQRLEDLGF